MVMYPSSKNQQAKEEAAAEVEASTSDTTFISYVKSLGTPEEGTINLFQRDKGDFYTCYGVCAYTVATCFYRTQSVLKYVGSSKEGGKKVKGWDERYDKEGRVACLSLKNDQARQFLRDFVLNGSLRVHIYAPSSHTSSKSRSYSSNSDWSLLLTASPGHTQPLDDLFDFSSLSLLANPVIMSLKVGRDADLASGGGSKVGAAFVDSQDRWMGIGEWVDDEGFGYTESILIQLGVKEVLLPALPSKSKRFRVPKLSRTSSSASMSASSNDDNEGEDQDMEQEEEDPETLKRQQEEDEAAELMRKDWEGVRIRGVMERCGISVVEYDRKKWNGKNVEKDVNRLLKGKLGLASRPEFDHTLALQSLESIISYLDLTSDPSNHGRYELRKHDVSKYMRLDGSALKALNLLPEGTGVPGAPVFVGGGRGRKNQSLFGVLNVCKTSQGTRKLGRWLKQPLLEKTEILERQKLLEFLFEDKELRTGLREDNLAKLPDLQRLAKKFQKGQATLEDVVRVYQAILRVPETRDLLENGVARTEDGGEGDVTMADGVDSSGGIGTTKELVERFWVDGLKKGEKQCARLVELVETTIDLDQLAHHEFILRADFDSSLTEIKKKLDKVTKGVKEEQNAIADDLGLDADGKTLHFEDHSLYGKCCRLTRKEAPRMQKKSGYIELSTQKAGVYFTTKKLKQYNEDFKEYRKRFERAQSGLVKQVISIAASYAPSLEALNKVIAHLDVIASFAEASASAPIPYIKPILSAKGEGDLVLKESRHPCLELQDGIDFIPNDVTLIRGKSEFQIITGPNMGGKSTYIRQIGVIALMAQIGCFVPCAEAQLPIFDSILARVGAGDSQIKGVSTFMAEMLETSTILKSATKNSLIIIDELGRGTSTSDGFGLAWAISEHIATDIRAFCLFASHYHELTKLADQIQHVDNIHVVCHVEERENTLTGKDITLLYRVEPGFSDQSFGIHVAQLANFPEEVVKLAKRKADDLEECGDDNDVLYTPEQVAEGIELAQNFVQAWIEKRESASSEMTVDGDADTNGRQQQTLKCCWEEYGPKMERNPWIVNALTQTY